MADEKIINSLTHLTAWIDQNGFAGWDPYDIKSKRWVIRLASRGNKSNLNSYLREIIYEFFYRFPLSSRKLLHVKKAINPKAMGLFASGFLQLYRTTKDEEHLSRAESCLEWLQQNAVQTDMGIGWGYPFDWQSEELIPAGTPNGIVTTAAGDAFWAFYKHTGKKEYLDFCIKISGFLASLPVDQLEDDKICFSYTPLFKNHVHNLNLFVAEFLIKTGMETNNDIWIQLGNKAVNYTLADQRPDGSFDYNGPPEKPQDFIDHYHTGFVLRMLYSIWELTDKNDVYAATEKCLKHYTGNFFEDSTLPWLMPDRKYRIDIHSCSESILCLGTLSPTWPEYLSMADNVIRWTIENLQDPNGYFYYGLLKSRFTGRVYKSRIPYIRWSQAWMLRAFASYLSISSK